MTVDGNTAIWKKPAEASCLPNQNEFVLDLCSTDDDPDEAWYFFFLYLQTIFRA